MIGGWVGRRGGLAEPEIRIADFVTGKDSRTGAKLQNGTSSLLPGFAASVT